MTEDTDKIAAALGRYYAMRDQRDELGDVLRSVSDEVLTLRRDIDRLTRRLDHLRSGRGFEKRSARLEREVETDLTQARNTYQRKLARRDQLAEQAKSLRTLVDRAEAFLTSGGASIAELEAGYARAPAGQPQQGLTDKGRVA